MHERFLHVSNPTVRSEQFCDINLEIRSCSNAGEVLIFLADEGKDLVHNLSSWMFFLVEIYFVNCKLCTILGIFLHNHHWKIDGNRYSFHGNIFILFINNLVVYKFSFDTKHRVYLDFLLMLGALKGQFITLF